MLPTCLTCPRITQSRWRYCIGTPLAISANTCTAPAALSAANGSSRPRADTQLRHQRGIDHRRPVGDSLKRPRNPPHRNPILKQITDAVPAGQQFIACSTSTCADSTMMAISGNSSRITPRASRPLGGMVGGIRMSATTGRASPRGTNATAGYRRRASPPLNPERSTGWPNPPAATDRRRQPTTRTRVTPSAGPELCVLPNVADRSTTLLHRRGDRTHGSSKFAASRYDLN